MNIKHAILFFTLVSNTAYAKWVLTGSVSDGSRNYIEQSSIRHEDGHIFVWAMADMSNVKKLSNGKSYSSVKTLFAFNCSKHTRGIKSFVAYSKNMGEGPVVSSVFYEPNEIEMKDVVPDTVEGNMLRRVCTLK